MLKTERGRSNLRGKCLQLKETKFIDLNKYRYVANLPTYSMLTLLLNVQILPLSIAFM